MHFLKLKDSISEREIVVYSTRDVTDEDNVIGCSFANKGKAFSSVSLNVTSPIQLDYTFLYLAQA